MSTAAERKAVAASLGGEPGADRALFVSFVRGAPAAAGGGPATRVHEFFQALPGDAASLWEACARRLASLGAGGEAAADPVEEVHAVASFARAHLEVTRDGPVADAFLELAAELHALLVDQGLAQTAEGRAAQREIGRLCEMYWQQGRARREELAGGTMVHLLGEAMGVDGRAADVRRAFAMRECLAWLELDDLPDEPSFLKYLFLHAAVHPRFVRQVEGRRLVAHLFAMPVPFADELHAAIKNSLPGARKSLLPLYGDVYLRAWKEAEGEALLRLESRSLQDLMHGALYARQPATAAAARGVLHVLHENKRRQKGLDEAVHRLYRPIIWRARADPNAAVRRNHAALFFDAFPVQDPGAGREEVAEQLQRQFDCFQSMLRDDDAQVRALAVRGVCRVLGTFWGLIPLAVTKALVARLVNDLAFDARAAGVRAAVFDGLAFVLEEHQSHAIGKLVLPVLAPLVNDRVESVRAAFVRLLQYVSTIRSIRFWDVVPLDRLMLRLAVEPSPRVSRQLVRLLMQSYFPHAKGRKAQLRRAVSMLRDHRAASKKFFAHVHEFVPLEKVCGLINILYRALRRAMRRDRAGENGGGNGEGDDDDGDDGAGGARGKGKGKGRSALTTDDPALVEAVLETMALLWLNVEDKLQQRANAALLKFLHETFQDGGLQSMLASFGTEPCRMAILTLASRVPAASLPSLRGTFVPHLASLRAGAVASDYAPAVACMLEWGEASEVLALLERGLAAAASGEAAPAPAPKKGKKGRRSKKAAAALDPAVAAGVVQYVTSNAHLRVLLFPRSRCEAYDRLLPPLAAAVARARELLDSMEAPPADAPETATLVACLEAHCKLHAMRAFAVHEEGGAARARAAAARAAGAGAGDDDNNNDDDDAPATLRVPAEIREALEAVSLSAAPALLAGAAGDDLPHRMVLFAARLVADLAAAGFAADEAGDGGADLVTEACRWLEQASAAHGRDSSFASDVAAPLYKLACHLAARSAASRDRVERGRLLERVDGLLERLGELTDPAAAEQAAGVPRAAVAEFVRALPTHAAPSELVAVMLRPALAAAAASDDDAPLVLDAPAQLGAFPAALLEGVARSRPAVRALARLARTGGPLTPSDAAAWVRVLTALRGAGETLIKNDAQRAKFLALVAVAARRVRDAPSGAPDRTSEAASLLAAEAEQERERCLRPEPVAAA